MIAYCAPRSSNQGDKGEGGHSAFTLIRAMTRCLLANPASQAAAAGCLFVGDDSLEHRMEIFEKALRVLPHRKMTEFSFMYWNFASGLARRISAQLRWRRRPLVRFAGQQIHIGQAFGSLHL